MSSTTVVDDDVVSTPVALVGHRFSWSAIFAGALVTTAVTFFLLAMGSGFGLSLVSAHHPGSNTATTFLTLGAVYAFAAQAFGFAAGGHVTGRLMGPVLENPKEEEFLAGSHGLVMWAVAVVASAVLIYLGAVSGGSAILGNAAGHPAVRDTNVESTVPGYWVDRLFRSQPEATHTSLAWRKYAQADTGTMNDATSDQPSDTSNEPAAPSPTAAPSPAVPMQGRIMPPPEPAAAMPAPGMTDIPVQAQQAHDIVADKAETARILNVGLANGGTLSDIDRMQLAHLISQDTGLTEDAAENRVKTVESQIHVDEVRTADVARKAAAYASLWTALALLFGGIVATAAAISARWEDDRITFGFGGR